MSEPVFFCKNGVAGLAFLMQDPLGKGFKGWRLWDAAAYAGHETGLVRVLRPAGANEG